jgi:hypothetical protein
MQGAEIATQRDSRLPALWMLAFVDAHHVWLVLSEIERLAWMYLIAN